MKAFAKFLACAAEGGGRPLLLRRLWVPVFMMAGIGVLSGSPGVQTGDWSFIGMDKVGHFVVFGLLAIAWARVFPRHSWSAGRVVLLATAAAAGFGALDELVQAFNPHRTFEWQDWVADAAGALAGAAAYVWLRPVQAFLELEFRHIRRLRLPRPRTN